MRIEKLKISRRVGLLDLYREKGFKLGVEVGTDRGVYAKEMLDRVPGLKLYCIDPWKPYKEGQDEHGSWEIEEIYKEAKLHLENRNATIIRQTSMQAVGTFKDNSLDFVFIDGDHRYPFVYQDITEWTKKVKKGGIVAGHDYVKDASREYGVVEAVNKYVEENNIDPLYILRKGTFVDCWMFYK